MSHRERSAPDILRDHYYAIDVLIIDDIQKLAGKAGTIDFFFDAFNHLTSAGKQIVLAADRSPSQLGAEAAFDERVTSRLDSGFSTSIQVPNYELKLRLITTFCERMHEDATEGHVGLAITGTISKENISYMAERAGTNIRVIEGFCQRCLIAMALSCSPRLLFADEPTTALDVTTEAQVLDVLKRLQAELGMAVVLISHNLGVIAQMCRRIYVMYAGVVVEEGTADDIFYRPAHPYTKCLLASLPDPSQKDKALTGIPGQAPDLFHMPQGCRFYPRCPRAMKACMEAAPPREEAGPGHYYRCWLAQAAAAKEALP